MLVEEFEIVPFWSFGLRLTVKLTALDSGFVMNKNKSFSAWPVFEGNPMTYFLPAPIDQWTIQHLCDIYIIAAVLPVIWASQYALLWAIVIMIIDRVKVAIV